MILHKAWPDMNEEERLAFGGDPYRAYENDMEPFEKVGRALFFMLGLLVVLAALLFGAGPDEKGGFPPQQQPAALEEIPEHPHEWNKTEITVALISTAGVIVVGIVPIVLMWKSKHRSKSKKG